MTTEIIAINILKIVFVIIGGHVVITRVVPLLNDFLLSFIKDKKSVESFTSLIDIFILAIVGFFPTYLPTAKLREIMSKGIFVNVYG